MMSSTKPKVHNVSQRRRRRIEPRPQATCTKNWYWSCMWFHRYLCGQTHTQTCSSQYTLKPLQWAK